MITPTNFAIKHKYEFIVEFNDKLTLFCKQINGEQFHLIFGDFYLNITYNRGCPNMDEVSHSKCLSSNGTNFLIPKPRDSQMIGSHSDISTVSRIKSRKDL